MNIGLIILSVLLIILVVLAVSRSENPGPIVQRAIEQFSKLVPRMFFALIAAGFIAQLIPQELIAQFLCKSAGLQALVVAAAVGLVVPAGPVIAFAIAVVFAKGGASSAALITFISSWTIFATHRILIYELPLLGASFLRLRVASVFFIPFVAGLLALGIGFLTKFGSVILSQ